MLTPPFSLTGHPNDHLARKVTMKIGVGELQRKIVMTDHRIGGGKTVRPLKAKTRVFLSTLRYVNIPDLGMGWPTYGPIFCRYPKNGYPKVLLQEGPYHQRLLLLLARCRREMRLEARSQILLTAKENGDNVTSLPNRQKRRQLRKPAGVYGLV